MATKTIYLTFNGYWRELNISGIPKKSGVYVVYECFYNQQTNKVDLKNIIYVGEAEDVNDRIANHEKWDEWRKYCATYNQICFSFAPVISPDKDRAEAALIYKHKPPVNDEYKDTFPFDETTISLSGETILLYTSFTVCRKNW